MCQAVRQAVDRHVADIARVDRDDVDFPYYFNERHAAAVCDFFPIMLRHSIGDYAGLPFELEPWQAFAVWCIFGWKCEADDSRRFRRFYWSVARKNGKSTSAAGLAVYLAAMDVNPTTGKPEDVAEVILSATKKEQVEKVIYSEIERMRARSKYIEKHSTRINKQITFKKNHGSIRCVGSDRPYDGLNPHAVLMDELHAWKEHHRKFYDTMQTGSGSRRQPLIGTVTTAGDDQSHLWLEEYRYCKGVLDRSIADERIFAYIFELDEDDEPLDEANWIKANPNLGVSVKLEFLRDQARQAKSSKLSLNRFTRYHCNRLVSSTEKAITLEDWDKCQGELSDWASADAVAAGVDLGARDDLAVFALCARFVIDERDGNPVYRYEIRCSAYIADDCVRDLTKRPFVDWVYNGLLTKSSYPIADLCEDLKESCAELAVTQVAYDPYNGQQIGESLTSEGIVAARMAQNCTSFNEPIRDFLQAINGGRLRHDGNLLLRWCANNAVMHRDRSDRWMFDKSNSEDKIDALVASVMAFRMCCVAPARPIGNLFL